MLNKIHHGDCLEVGKYIDGSSVDLIVCDPPYGKMKGINEVNFGYGRKNHDGHMWDTAINPRNLFEVANRILRRNGKLILFSQEPYTSRLITDAIGNLPFCYRMIWEKDDFANALLVNKAPVNYYEDILVFSKTHDTDGLHPLREYFAQVLGHIGESRNTIIKALGQRVDHTLRTNSTQFALCTESTYEAIIEHYAIDKMPGFKKYEELRDIDDDYKTDLPSVFNLPPGAKYKSNILRYKKDYDGFHPTQKPIALLEDLIKTYSDKGDVVVDLTCGSGSTCVAALNTGRFFIGIEQEKEYVDITNKRIKDFHKQKELELV